MSGAGFIRLCGATLFLAFIFRPEAAYGYDAEFYTYGGFTAVTLALRKAALIMSDGGYRALFVSATILAILWGGARVYYDQLTGGQEGWLSFTSKLIFGVMIYLTFIVQTGNLTVYDPVQNRMDTIGDLPDGIVLLAGNLNLIERGIVDIIDTSGSPESISEGAGGIGFNALLKATGGGIKLGDPYVDYSFKKYTEDCLYFELMRPGSALSINDIKRTSTDLRDEYAQAQLRAIYTTWYDEANRRGTTMTCADAWDNLNTYLSDPSNLEDARRVVCSLAGFDPDNASQYARCMDTIEEYAGYTSGVAVGDSIDFIRQVYMAQRLDYTLQSNNPDLALISLANRNTMTTGISAGMLANEWLPVIRAVVTAVAFGLLPFLALFIVTPYVGRALSVIAGMLIWLTMWGITDAVTHSLAADYAMEAYEEVRQSSLGYDAIMYMPGASQKALSVFGTVRTIGIMLATALTTMLVRFGSHAMAMMAGNIAGRVESTGTGAAMKTQTPEGAAQTKESQSVSLPTHAWAWNYGLNERTASGAYRRFSQTESALQTATAMGGVSRAADAVGHTQAKRSVSDYGWASNISFKNSHDIGAKRAADIAGTLQGLRAAGDFMSQAQRISALDQINRVASTDQADKGATALGYMNDSDRNGFISEDERMAGLQKFYAMKARGGVLDKDAADHLNQKFGTDVFVAGRTRVDDIAFDKYGEISQMKTSGEMTKKELERYRDNSLEKGQLHTAAGVQRLISNMEDDGSESAHVEMTLGREGSVSTFSAKHGSRTDYYDTADYKFASTTVDGIEKETYGLSNQAEVKQLRRELTDKKYEGRFDNIAAGIGAGMLLNLTRDKKGNILTVDAAAGGTAKKVDLASSETGTRIKAGSERLAVKTNTIQGVQYFEDPVTGDAMQVYGTWQLNEKDRVVSGKFQAGQDGQYFSMRQGADGNWNLSNVNTHLSKDGTFIHENADSISTRKLVNRGFVETQQLSSDGKILHSANLKGQKATVEDKFKVDLDDDVKLSNLRALRFATGKDPSAFADEHPGMIAVYGSGKYVLDNVEGITKIIRSGKVIKGDSPKGALPTIPKIMVNRPKVKGSHIED